MQATRTIKANKLPSALEVSALAHVAPHGEGRPKKGDNTATFYPPSLAVPDKAATKATFRLPDVRKVGAAQ
jgi:hypothetical protein